MIKALSLWQPWASAIAIGEKSVETRHWATGYRGPLLIHAAKKGPRSEVQMLINELELDLDIHKIPFGALIAVADLVRCSHTESMKVSEREESLGDFYPGRYGWELENVRAFVEPIPYRGAQGLFNVPDEVVAEAIRSAIPTKGGGDG